MTESFKNNGLNIPIASNIHAIEFVNKIFHERLKYFLITDVFDKEEITDDAFLYKYNLNTKFRDFIVANKKMIPENYPIKNIHFDKNDNCELISIRAMHRIACSELTTGKIHFMFDSELQESLVNEYDNSHGSIITSMIQDKWVPVKYTMDYEGISLKKNIKLDIPSLKPTNLIPELKNYRIDVVHIDSVWNINREPGFLIYFIDKNIINSFYIDSYNAKKISITFKNEMIDKLLMAQKGK